MKTNLDEIKPYIIKLPDEEIELYKSNVECSNFKDWFYTQINLFLNATRTWSNGQRPVMTSYISYKTELTATLTMIEYYSDEEDLDNYYEEVLKRHRENIEFETINPYTYKSSKTNRKTKTKKSVQLELYDCKEQKETVASKRLKEHAIKMNQLKFKIKP